MFKNGIDPKKFEILIEITNWINSNYNDDKLLLTQILDSAMRLSEGEASSLLLLNAENEKLYFEIALGTKGTEIQKYSVAKGEGIAGWVALNNKSLIVNDVDQDPRFYANISKKIGYTTKSILAVPMRVKDTCVGVIEIINKKGTKFFTNEDLTWLEIFANQAAIAIQNAQSYSKAMEEITDLKNQVHKNQEFHTFIGVSPIIQEKLELVDKIAPTDSSVLIFGESGVGKELFAERIHLLSKRKNKPFIRVNCAAIPENLLESELFGHVKGAFTDASHDRRGRFELADTGTIFLDEIGDIPLNLQPKLLRVLQNKTFEPVGSSSSMTVDIRIIAATNKNLDELVQTGQFRSDLYYRLNVLPLFVPPLRERIEDISALAEFFLERFRLETKKKIVGFSDSAMQLLLTYAWPGNIRELENTIERAVVLSKDTILKPEDMILNTASADDEYSGKDFKEAITIFKRNFIRRTLELNQQSISNTAKVLNIQRTYLSRLVSELQIK